jgi:opacity protein-like surface antigen
MKRALILAAAIVLATTGAQAQGFEWGVKAGVNVARQTVFAEPTGLGGGMETQPRVGMYAGVFAEKTLSDIFGVQAELLYAPMGMKGNTGSISYGFKTDYLVLPVLAKLYVWKGISVEAGPQFGCLLSAKGVGGSRNDAALDDFKQFDVALAAGLSYRVTNRVDLSARLNRGLTGMTDHSDARNVSWSLGAGYRF